MVITSGSKKVNEVFFFLIAWGKLRACDVELDLFFAHSLDAIDPNAYEAFQASNNLTDVVQRCLQKKESNAGVLPGMSKKLSIKASLMTPVKPMLVWCLFTLLLTLFMSNEYYFELFPLLCSWLAQWVPTVQRVYIYLSWSDSLIISTGVSLPMLKYYVLSNVICQEVCNGSRTSPGKPLPDLSQILPPGEKCASYNKGVLIGLVTRYLF